MRVWIIDTQKEWFTTRLDKRGGVASVVVQILPSKIGSFNLVKIKWKRLLGIDVQFADDACSITRFFQ